MQPGLSLVRTGRQDGPIGHCHISINSAKLRRLLMSELVILLWQFSFAAEAMRYEVDAVVRANMWPGFDTGLEAICGLID